MSYTLILTPQAEEHLAEWKKSGQKKTTERRPRRNVEPAD